MVKDNIFSIIIMLVAFCAFTYSLWDRTKDNEELQENYLKLVAENKMKDELINYYGETQGIKYTASVSFPWDDVYLLARLVHSEAGTESMEAKKYVASVVMNRVGCDMFPNTIRDVVYQSSQFSVVDIIGSNGVPMIDEPPEIEDIEVAYNILKDGSILPQRVLYFWDDSIEPIRSGVYEKIGHLLFAY